MNARLPQFAADAAAFTSGHPAPYESTAQINARTERISGVRREIESLPPLKFSCTVRELKHAIIDCDPLSHRDLVDVLMGLAAKVKKGVGSALGDECARSVASHLADIADVIEADLASQQAEAAWSERS
jgi:hypothetical protein